MKIIIATDGSEFSRAAIKKTCRIIANPEKTEVRVIAAYREVLPLDAFPQSVEYAEQQERSARTQAEEFAQEGVSFIEQNFPNSGLRVAGRALAGAADEVLIDQAKEWNADMIVVGSHGRGFLERTFSGSISDSLVHHAPCSVFVVRPIKNKNE